MKALKESDGNQIKEDIEANGSITVEGHELSNGDVLFDSELPDDFVSSEFEGGNVFVNTNVTLEIKQEAMARELIRRIQDMRKDLDLDVEANINVDVETSDEFKELIVPQSEVISHEVRAKSLIISTSEECSKYSKDYTKEWDIFPRSFLLKMLLQLSRSCLRRLRYLFMFLDLNLISNQILNVLSLLVLVLH